MKYPLHAVAQELADRFDAGDRDVYIVKFGSRWSLLRFGFQFVCHALFSHNPVAPRGFNNALISDHEQHFWTHLTRRPQP